MQSSSATYIPRLDHLRFVAVVLVFGWHSLHMNAVIPFDYSPPGFFFSIFEEGHTGVSLFLTLSGFVFASLCDGREILYAPFIRNRVLRILPLLAVWTVLNYQLLRPPADHLFAILVGLQNQEFPGPGWTVIVEFQLYLVFPFLLAFAERYGTKYLFGVTLVTLVLRGIAWLVTRNVEFIAYWTVLGRADEFVFGMIGFRAYRRYGKILGNPFCLFGVLFAWLCIYHWFNRLGGYYFSATHLAGSALWIYFPTLEGLFYATLTASYLSLPWRGIPALGRAAAWMGSVSYSMYLCHAMVVQAAFSSATSLGIRVTTPLRIVLFSYCVVLPLVVACSALTYNVIELPFLRLRHPYLRERRAGE
jgi:peptidoglycan/LPS O-acetylase OafA/YrhL